MGSQHGEDEDVTTTTNVDTGQEQVSAPAPATESDSSIKEDWQEVEKGDVERAHAPPPVEPITSEEGTSLAATTEQGGDLTGNASGDESKPSTAEVRTRLARAQFIARSTGQSFVAITGAAELVRTVQENYVKPGSDEEQTSGSESGEGRDRGAEEEGEKGILDASPQGVLPKQDKVQGDGISEGQGDGTGELVTDAQSAADQVTLDPVEAEEGHESDDAIPPTASDHVATDENALPSTLDRESIDPPEDTEADESEEVNPQDSDPHDSEAEGDPSPPVESTNSDHDDDSTVADQVVRTTVSASELVDQEDAGVVTFLRQEAARSAQAAKEAAQLAEERAKDLPEIVPQSDTMGDGDVGGDEGGFFLTGLDGPSEQTTIDQLQIALAQSTAQYAQACRALADRDEKLVTLAEEAVSARAQARQAIITSKTFEAQAIKYKDDMYRAYDLMEQQAEEARQRHSTLLDAAFSDIPEERYVALSTYVEDEKESLIRQVQTALAEISEEKEARIEVDGGDWVQRKAELRAEYEQEVALLKEQHAAEIEHIKNALRDGALEVVQQATKRVAAQGTGTEDVNEFERSTRQPATGDVEGERPESPSSSSDEEYDPPAALEPTPVVTEGSLGDLFEAFQAKVSEAEILPSSRQASSRHANRQASRGASRHSSRSKSRQGVPRTAMTPPVVSMGEGALEVIPEKTSNSARHTNPTTTANTSRATSRGSLKPELDPILLSSSNTSLASSGPAGEDADQFMSPYAKDNMVTVASRSEFITADAALLEEARLRNWGTPLGTYPTGDVTLVFAQVSHIDALWARRPKLAAEALMLANANIRELLTVNDGREVLSLGDRYLFAFKETRNAVKFALEVQRDLMLVDWPKGLLKDSRFAEAYDERLIRNQRGLTLSMGLHCGLPVCQTHQVTGVTEYRGPVVLLASRIAAAAAKGQILVSKRVVEEAGDLTVLKAQCDDVGTHQLAGVSGEHHLYQVMPTSLCQRAFDKVNSVTTIINAQEQRVDELSSEHGPSHQDTLHAQAVLTAMTTQARKLASSTQDACFKAFTDDVNRPVRKAQPDEAMLQAKQRAASAAARAAGVAKTVSFQDAGDGGGDGDDDDGSNKPVSRPPLAPVSDRDRMNPNTSGEHWTRTDALDRDRLQCVLKDFDTALSRFKETQMILESPRKRAEKGVTFDHRAPTPTIPKSHELFEALISRFTSASEILVEAARRTEALPAWDGKSYKYPESEVRRAVEEQQIREAEEAEVVQEGTGDAAHGEAVAPGQDEDSVRPPSNAGTSAPAVTITGADHATARLRHLEMSRQILYEHPDFTRVRDLRTASVSLRFRLLACKYEIRKLSNWGNDIDHWVNNIPDIAKRINTQRFLLRRLKEEASRVETERNRALAERNYVIKDLKRIVGNLLHVDFANVTMHDFKKKQEEKKRKKPGKLEWRIVSSRSLLDAPPPFLGSGLENERPKRRDRTALPPVFKQKHRVLKPASKQLQFEESGDPSSISMNSFRSLRRAIVSPQERVPEALRFAPHRPGPAGPFGSGAPLPPT